MLPANTCKSHPWAGAGRRSRQAPGVGMVVRGGAVLAERTGRDAGAWLPGLGLGWSVALGPPF